MLLTLAEIKAQCRIDADITDEDGQLQLLGRAAEARVQRYLNRSLYLDAVPDTDPDGLVLTDDIRLGLLLLVGHWYEHREAVTDFEQSETPMTFYFLLQSYRHIPL